MVADVTFSLLSRLFALLKSAAGPHAIYSGIADMVLSVLGSDAVALFEYEVGRDALVLGTARQLSLEAQTQLGRALTRRLREDDAWQERAQFVRGWGTLCQSEDPATVPDLAAMDWLLCVPLHASDDALLGMLVALCRTGDCDAMGQQVQISLLGGLASMALENAQLYAAQRSRADFLAALLRIGELLQVDQSLDAVLNQIARAITGVLGWQNVVITLIDHTAEECYPAAWHSTDAAFAARLAEAFQSAPRQSMDAPQLWRQPVFQVGHAYYVDHRLPEAQGVALRQDAFYQVADVPATRESLAANQWQSADFLVVPLRLGQVELGWMVVDQPLGNRRPDQVRLQELELFADQAAQAVVNARVYNQAEHERLKLTNVLDGLADGILAWGEHEQMLFYNREAVNLLGLVMPGTPDLSLAALLGSSPLLPRLQDPTWRYGEIDLQQDRRTLEVRVSVLPYVGQMAVLRDVTFFRRMERQRLELLSTLGHDLKNPLASIRFIASLIERSGDLNPPQHQYVGRLRSVAQQSVALIDDLLEMARLEAGSHMVEAPVVLHDILAQVIEEYRIQAEEKHITVQYVPDDALITYGDAGRLRQVFANLMGNAVKYTPEAGTVRIDAALANDEVVICVQDDGLGIAAEDLPYVFDRFFRAHPQLKVEGTGLGLSIARAVVERHNGRLWVESVEGQGSTFFVALPAIALPASGLSDANLPETGSPPAAWSPSPPESE
ncbi:MAG: GAF domain-containing sensor histidine kinase [Anaerolineae bacterium]|nr:GAF domain-containing sensor histidine kinase [Anaerolineae bacterium]